MTKLPSQFEGGDNSEEEIESPRDFGSPEYTSETVFPEIVGKDPDKIEASTEDRGLYEEAPLGVTGLKHQAPIQLKNPTEATKATIAELNVVASQLGNNAGGYRGLLEILRR